MKKIETVTHRGARLSPPARRHRGDQATTAREDFRNRLIWGDNRLVMASLLKEFRVKIDLIYIDPSLMSKEAEIIIYLNQ